MQDSETTAGESQLDTSQAGESREPSLSQIEQVAKLLDPEAESETSAKADSETGDQKSEKASESDDSPPKTFNEFAERHGVDVKDLYELQFNYGEGDGESRTLGELKDIAVTADQLEVDRLTFEETRQQKETEYVRATAELQEIVGMLPKGSITPELLQIIANKRAAVLERESKLTLSAIPEWNDDATETAERGQMREHLSAYGFPSNYLESVTDHKTLKYIRDNMQRQQRIERVLAQVKQVNKPGHKPSAKPTKPVRKTPARKRSTVETQVEKVAELLANAS